jgi:hypothetical protein
VSLKLDIKDIVQRVAAAEVVSPDGGATLWAVVRVALPDRAQAAVELTEQGEIWLRPVPMEPGLLGGVHAQRKLAVLTPALASWRAAELLVEAAMAAEAGTLDDFASRRKHGA